MNESKPARRVVSLAVGAAYLLALGLPVRADTLPGALAQAYSCNPVINAQRAALRATDEGVGIALSGYRPTIKGTIQDGWADQSQMIRSPRVTTDAERRSGAAPTAVEYPTTWANYASQQYTIAATQTLYNGFQTANRTRQAESQVSAGRETLRLTELNLLLQGATVYMDLLRDAATLELNKSRLIPVLIST
jgi:outer membrane protein